MLTAAKLIRKCRCRPPVAVPGRIVSPAASPAYSAARASDALSRQAARRLPGAGPFPGAAQAAPTALRPARLPHSGHSLYDQLMKSHDRIHSRRTRA